MCITFVNAAGDSPEAGGEFDTPVDFPSNRLDTDGAASVFNFVGALEISTGSGSYRGTASALSPNWVLTAGHNVDFNDDGQVDGGLTLTFHLPGWGNYTASSIFINPDFTGFGNPTVHNDLSLLYFADPLPLGLQFPSLGSELQNGDLLTLVGYGRSGWFWTPNGTGSPAPPGWRFQSLLPGFCW